MWTKLGKTLLVALLVVTTAELVALAALGRVEFAHSYDEPRNPNYRRAWPAFTAPRPRGPNEKLVILISNSQGYAPEIQDAELVYARRLQVQLNEQDPAHRYTVANWSIGGASGPEMLLLAARAVDHDPDLFMVVTHSEPFTYTLVRLKLPAFISDSNQLMCDRSIRNRMPAWFLKEKGEPDLALTLESRSGLVRLGAAFVEHREKRWVARQLNLNRAPGPGSTQQQGAARVRKRGERLFRTVIRTFHERRPDTPVLVVGMPLCEPLWRPDSWPGLHDFGGQMRDVLAQRFPDDPWITVVDAVDEIDEDLFITRAHMSPQGHAEFARFLLPHVRTCLDGPPER
jgi:hypothetical protein